MREWRHRARASDAGRRLDHLLAERLEDVTRSRLKRLIDDGLVTVDGRRVKAGHPVAAGEEIAVDIPPPPAITPEPESVPLHVVYEDDALLVVDKPAGMAVHPGAGRDRGTLVNALLGRGGPLSTLGAPQRPGIVHRLDKDTSGLLVVARTEAAHRTLSADLAERRFLRRYWTLVWGALPDAEGLVDANLGRSAADRRRMRVVPAGGRPARTRYRVLAAVPPVSVLAVRLETGRTHQIRAHFRHLGHPVFGDPDYGGRGRARGSLPVGARERVREALAVLPRQALHAAELGFTHPVTGRERRWESPLPDDMLGAAAALGVPSAALTLDRQEDA